MFSTHTIFELGDSSKIKFWDNMWCREMALKEVFLDLYNIACVKDTSIAFHFDLSSGSLQSNASIGECLSFILYFVVFL